MHKYNSLAMMGIKPPRPFKKLQKSSQNISEETSHVTSVTSNNTLIKDAPEFPPRYQNRFGGTIDVKKLQLDAETFKNESRDFIHTVKNTNEGLAKFFVSQSPIRAAAASIMENSRI